MRSLGLVSSGGGIIVMLSENLTSGSDMCGEVNNSPAAEVCTAGGGLTFLLRNSVDNSGQPGGTLDFWRVEIICGGGFGGRRGRGRERGGGAGGRMVGDINLNRSPVL